MNTIFIVDIDMTVCNSKDRVDAISKKYNLAPEFWVKECFDEFTKNDSIKNDKLIVGAEILPHLARRCKAKIIFLTGRSNVAREATLFWLRAKLDIYSTVPLIMRNEGDMSSAVDCKIKLFEDIVLKIYQTNNFIFFDDDLELLEKYSKYGMCLKAPECWQNIIFIKDIK